MHCRKGEGEDNIVAWQVEIVIATSTKSFYSTFCWNVSGFFPSYVQFEQFPK